MAHGAAVWLPFVQPFGTVLIGLGAGFIAYRQWRTASNKVRLDLFEHRLKAFNQLSAILDGFCTNINISPIDAHNLFALQRGASILFGTDYVKAAARCVKHVEEVVLSEKQRSPEDIAKSVAEIRLGQKDLFTAFVEHAGLSHIK